MGLIGEGGAGESSTNGVVDEGGVCEAGSNEYLLGLHDLFISFLKMLS
jgi:hypothetical protein